MEVTKTEIGVYRVEFGQNVFFWIFCGKGGLRKYLGTQP